MPKKKIIGQVTIKTTPEKIINALGALGEALQQNLAELQAVMAKVNKLRASRPLRSSVKSGSRSSVKSGSVKSKKLTPSRTHQ